MNADISDIKRMNTLWLTLHHQQTRIVDVNARTVVTLETSFHEGLCLRPASYIAPIQLIAYRDIGWRWRLWKRSVSCYKRRTTGTDNRRNIIADRNRRCRKLRA